ncbi:MAG TPA: hypothetical protein VFI93_06660 [Rhizomicrobium sp.]|nr:hypothetical protein [Rhizomicrobium sp.]
MQKEHGENPGHGHIDWRNRRLDQLERIHAGANAGLCGDGGMIIAVAEMLERIWLGQRRKRP